MSKEEVSLCMNVNGESKVPPGFRFHPTEEELLHYYLRKKVAYEKIDLDVIREVDLNKLEPWDIQDRCKIGSSTPQNEWYFFSHKDKKYPSGTRTNRATEAGFWKATGRDKVIHSNLQRIGMRKTLVFYKGRAPHGQKSDWIMHEYRLLDHDDHTNNIIPTQEYSSGPNSLCDYGHEEGWVVCRVFKKKNYHKSSCIEVVPKSISKSDSRSANDAFQSLNYKDDDDDVILEELLMAEMDSKSCKIETDNFTNDVMQQFINPNFNNDILAHDLPAGLSSPAVSPDHHVFSADFDRGGSSSLENYKFVEDYNDKYSNTNWADVGKFVEDYNDKYSNTNWADVGKFVEDYNDEYSNTNWADVGKFVAYQLDQGRQMEHVNQKWCFSVNDHNEPADLSRPNELLDIWSLARSSMEPLYHLTL